MSAPLQHPLWPEEACDDIGPLRWLVSLRFFWLCVGVLAGAALATLFT